MKISLLIKREPFKKIFKETFEFFLKEYYNTNFQIVFHDNMPEIVDSNSEIWICNPLINSIFKKNIKKELFQIVNSELSVNPTNKWKTYAQQLYLFISQSSFLSKYFAKYFITISPKIPESEHKLIIGGNNKFRIIDLKNNCIHVLLKNGFDSKFMKRELFVRNNFPFLKSTKLYDYNDNDKWYKEEIIKGVPLDRFLSKEKNIFIKLL